MFLQLYSMLMRLGGPLLRRKLRRRGATEPGYLEAVDERFGRYAMPASAGSVWVHAVSLGETRAAAILIDELRRRMPGMRLLLTHGTATGRAEGARLLREGDLQVWQPWDSPGAVRRFLAHFQPAVGVLMETEVWPNLVAQCKARGIPLALANARLNDKSLAQAEKLGMLAYPAFAALSAVWAQTEDDATRLRELGAPVAGVFGNLKFDATPDAGQLARGRTLAAGNKPVVMLASSRDGEEEAFLHAIRHAASALGVQWLIVPRHPQRFDDVAALVQRHGFSVARRSTWPSAEGAGPPAADVWLGDSLGEMALYYGVARVALLGGSFEPLGGQNLIEAAACGCPVVMGPSTFNFAQAAELAVGAGAALRVASMAEGVAAASALAADTPRCEAMSANARRFAAAHQGAAAKTADAVLALFRAPAAR